MSIYEINLQPDDNDTFLITCPLLPEVTTFCEDRLQWEATARAAIEEALAGRIARGEDAPTVSHIEGPFDAAVMMPMLTSMKVDLYNAMRAAGVTKAALGRLLGVHPPQVDRLFQLDHASRLDQIEAAFKALKLQPVVTFTPVEAKVA